MIEIVKFKNGKYGIRKRNFIQKIFNLEGVFRDFKPFLYYWRTPSNPYFDHCELDTIEEVNDFFNRMNGDFVKEVIKTKTK